MKPRVAVITDGGNTLCLRLASIRFLHCKTIPGQPLSRELTIHTDGPMPLVITVSERVAQTLVGCLEGDNWE